MSKRKKEFEGLVAAGLAKFRNRAVAKLRTILGKKLPPEVGQIWFTIQSDDRGLPVTYSGMDATGANGGYRKNPKTGELEDLLSGELAPGYTKPYLPDEAIEEYNDDVPVGSYEYAARLIAGFVRECYLEAGGAGHPLPAYAHHHDRGTALDLKTGRWVSTEDIYNGKV